MPLGKPIQNTTMQVSQKTAGSDIEFELLDPQFCLDDVIVSSETAHEISGLISLKKNHEVVFGMMGFSTTHKKSKKFVVNFYGEPGTGKTITAHAISREFGKKLLLVDYSQIESKYVGDTPKNLKKVFDFAKTQNCIIFFDEADAILSRRVTNMQSSTDTSVNQTRSVLLNILNDFDGDIIFATNFISNYDAAFMRRISKHVRFSLPDQKVRKMLIRKYVPQAMVGIDYEFLGNVSEGLSAADIENATLMAAFSAVSDGRIAISTHDIELQINAVKDSKKSNSPAANQLVQRHVPEDYVNKQLGVN